MHKCLYSEPNEEILDVIKRLMYTNSQPLPERLIRALKGLYAPEIVEYLLGVYYLEFAKTYVLGRGRYIETNVSLRRARRHLKRALRIDPQDVEILTALGEAYARERRPLPAFAYFEKAWTLVPDNARFVWNLMEQSFLLARDEKVLSCDAAFHWEACMDPARYFWCGVLCGYSAARLGKTEETREMAERMLQSHTSELPQPDLAAACLLDVLFLAGWTDEMKKQYEKLEQETAHISSPLLTLLHEGKSVSISKKLTDQIIASFTPRSLLPHLVW